MGACASCPAVLESTSDLVCPKCLAKSGAAERVSEAELRADLANRDLRGRDADIAALRAEIAKLDEQLRAADALAGEAELTVAIYTASSAKRPTRLHEATEAYRTVREKGGK